MGICRARWLHLRVRQRPDAAALPKYARYTADLSGHDMRASGPVYPAHHAAVPAAARNDRLLPPTGLRPVGALPMAEGLPLDFKLRHYPGFMRLDGLESDQ